MTQISCIEDLRLVVESERLTTGRGRLGDKTLVVLESLLRSPGVAAVDSISSLAEQCGVDPSTLTRLGKRLGFKGFSELQDVFRRHVAQANPFYSARVQQRISDSGAEGGGGFLQQHAHTECQKLLTVVDALDPAVVARAVDLLVGAKHVYLLGLRATYSLAYFMGSYLSTFRQQVTILGGPGHALASDMARIGSDDVLVAMSFRPYTKAVVNAVAVAKESHVPILSLTDADSPLVLETGQGVTLQTEQPFYFDSSTAHFFVIQTLLLATARRLGPVAVDVAQRRERIYRAMDIEEHGV